MNMIRIVLFSLALLSFPRPVFTQVLQVSPGDATNNGIINNIDFLEIGLGYNFSGPNRGNLVGNDLSLTPQAVNPWPLSLPSGLNMAYADCDGNGKINFSDLNPIFVNYGAQRTDIEVKPDVFMPGTSGMDPKLRLTSINNNLIAPGENRLISIQLGTADLPAEDLYGLAFSLHFNEQIDVSQVKLDLGQTSWANNDGDRIFFHKRTAPKRIDVGWTRTDRNNRSGFGEIGTLELVIIVDVIDWASPMRIWTDSIRMIDKFGNISATAGDTLSIDMDPDGLSTSTNVASTMLPNVSVSPNPLQNDAWVVSDHLMERIRIFNLLGQPVLDMPVVRATQIRMNVPNLPNGAYFLQVDTDAGPTTTKIYISK